MKRFIYDHVADIPDNRLEDVLRLRHFIMNNLNIDISVADTYRFWDSVSSSWSAGWLYIDTHYTCMTREEFLLGELQKYGTII